MWIVTTPIIYLFLRAAYAPPVLALGEYVFLIIYSSIISIHYCFAYCRRNWIADHSPKWLNSYWARIPLYFAILLALTGILNLLKLPTFYDTIIGKSLMFLVLPYMLRFPRTVKTSPVNRTLITSSSSQSDEDLTFRPKPSRAIFVLAASLAFVLGGIFMLPKEPALAWICIGFFGLGIPVGILMLIPGCYCLILKRDEFIIVNLGRRLACRWTDVTDFVVVKTPQGPRVGWNFSQNVSNEAPYWRKRIAARKWVTETYGRNALLADDYGVAPEELCRLMIELSTRAQRTTPA